MNVEALNADLKEISQNLAAVRGEDFARTALVLSQVDSLIAAIHYAAEGDKERAEPALIVSRNMVANFGAIIASLLDVHPRELTTAADTIIAKIRQHATN